LNGIGNVPGILRFDLVEPEGVVGVSGEEVLGEDQGCGDSGGCLEEGTAVGHGGSLGIAQEKDSASRVPVRFGVKPVSAQSS
jgi:hypothetical protein